MKRTFFSDQSTRGELAILWFDFSIQIFLFNSIKNSGCKQFGDEKHPVLLTYLIALNSLCITSYAILTVLSQCSGKAFPFSLVCRGVQLPVLFCPCYLDC